MVETETTEKPQEIVAPPVETPPLETPKEPDWKAQVEAQTQRADQAERSLRQFQEQQRSTEISLLHQAERDDMLRRVMTRQDIIAQAMESGEMTGIRERIQQSDAEHDQKQRTEAFNETWANTFKQLQDIATESGLKLEDPLFQNAALYYNRAISDNQASHFDKAVAEALRAQNRQLKQRGQEAAKKSEDEAAQSRRKREAEALDMSSGKSAGATGNFKSINDARDAYNTGRIDTASWRKERERFGV